MSRDCSEGCWSSTASCAAPPRHRTPCLRCDSPRVHRFLHGDESLRPTVRAQDLARLLKLLVDEDVQLAIPRRRRDAAPDRPALVDDERDHRKQRLVLVDQRARTGQGSLCSRGSVVHDEHMTSFAVRDGHIPRTRVTRKRCGPGGIPMRRHAHRTTAFGVASWMPAAISPVPVVVYVLSGCPHCTRHLAATRSRHRAHRRLGRRCRWLPRAAEGTDGWRHRATGRRRRAPMGGADHLVCLDRCGVLQALADRRPLPSPAATPRR